MLAAGTSAVRRIRLTGIIAMKRLLPLGIALAGLLAAPLSANATLVTQTRNFTESSVITTTGNPASALLRANLNFSSFDQTLGTLNAVTVSIQGIAQAEFSLRCAGPLPLNLPGCIEVGAISSINLLDAFPRSTQNSIGAVGSRFTPLLALGAGGNGRIAGDYQRELDLLELLPLEDFLAGPVSLPLFAFARVTGTGGVEGTALLNSFSGSATLTYDFTEAPAVVAVPAPTSLPILAAGLAVFGFAARRRRR